jgi:hypothetical protein
LSTTPPARHALGPSSGSDAAALSTESPTSIGVRFTTSPNSVSLQAYPNSFSTRPETSHTKPSDATTPEITMVHGNRLRARYRFLDTIQLVTAVAAPRSDHTSTSVNGRAAVGTLSTL